jgi:hypothetical protein
LKARATIAVLGGSEAHVGKQSMCKSGSWQLPMDADRKVAGSKDLTFGSNFVGVAERGADFLLFPRSLIDLEKSLWDVDLLKLDFLGFREVSDIKQWVMDNLAVMTKKQATEWFLQCPPIIF